MTDRNDEPPGSRPARPEGAAGAAGHVDDDLCADIVSGLARPDEVDRAMAHIRTCVDCDERLITAAALREMARTRPTPAFRRDSGGPIIVPAGNRAPAPARWILRAALPIGLAAATLVMVTILTRHSPSGEAYWIPATGDLLELRGAHQTDSDSVFWTGLKAYETHDVRNSISLLRSAHAAGGLDDLRRLYLASLFVNSNRAGEALKLLKELEIESIPLPWREDARWLEYLALTSLHQDAEARARLDEMAGWPGRIGDLARDRKRRTPIGETR